ncbi:MAG: GFA family protein [Sphingomonadales bacterium]|nr:GFA family protein [Sphingomonadales bacterium]MDE2568950.1 GFA family protein [Sphingomonadales bacterium]
MTETKRQGGCLCGAVRYEAPWPPAILVTCACTNCQKQSGGAVSVVGAVARDALKLEGELKTYVDSGASGKAVYRLFCPECGSAVLTDTDAAREQGIIFIKAGTLDDTSDLAPKIHCWTSRKQAWLSYPEGDTIMQQQEGLG